MDFSIFPVEFYVIKKQAGDNLKNAKKPGADGDCPFLVNHRCVIYDARPIICRTQGLPLLYMGEEEWELSACELNFTDFDFDEFIKENTLPQDKYNSRLFLLNQKFIENIPDKPFRNNDLIPLKKLFTDKENDVE
jgi:Fe-S-cluster containining protein